MSYPENKLIRTPLPGLGGLALGGVRKTLGVQGCGVKDYQEITPTLEDIPCRLLVKRFFMKSDLSDIGLL